MIHFMKGSFLWKWSSPERILKTLPFFIYKFFRTYVQHKVRDSDQDASHPARGRGKQSGSRLPQDNLGKVPLAVAAAALDFSILGPVQVLSCLSGKGDVGLPTLQEEGLGFSTGTAISWEHKADTPDFLLSWTWPHASAIG